jgi:hypothetical protein
MIALWVQDPAARHEEETDGRFGEFAGKSLEDCGAPGTSLSIGRTIYLADLVGVRRPE